MVGGDLPGWLPSLFRRAGAAALTDRRGECVYAGCPHYRRCFIERAERASREADIVIANHALVMVNAARAREDAPGRILFDEGHHLFDAANSTFAVAFGGQEAIELRRWIVGPEGRSRGRRRGLAARLMDVASYDEEGARALDAAVEAARCSRRTAGCSGWSRAHRSDRSRPCWAKCAAPSSRGRKRRRRATGLRPSSPSRTARWCRRPPRRPRCWKAWPSRWRRWRGASRPCSRMLPTGSTHRLGRGSMAPSADLHGGARRSRRGLRLLSRIGGEADPEFVDWLAVERVDGREYDVAIQRRWLDPTKPLAAAVIAPADGVLVTSATLRGGEDWSVADARTGALHLPVPAAHFEADSPFDYAACSEVLIVTDIKQGDVAALAGAYARLIATAEGGTLGLFTAIQRLKAVHARIADRLARDGLPLLAQHVDPIDAGTLVDIFRDDPRASLLGTDALRDGVDVPGESLRLVVMERVPWPRPTVLHAARRMAGGGSAYDDRVVRARLAQAFGRLIRRQDDRGLFVILSAAMPSRLLRAFPPGVPVSRVPLDVAVARVEQFLPGTVKSQRTGKACELTEGAPSTALGSGAPRIGAD